MRRGSSPGPPPRRAQAEGIRTIDNISREETHRVFLPDLQYYAAVPLKKKKSSELFVTVSRDQRLRHVRLRLYRCSEKGAGESAADTVRSAFAAAERAKAIRGGQPFMAIASLAATTAVGPPVRTATLHSGADSRGAGRPQRARWLLWRWTDM